MRAYLFFVLKRFVQLVAVIVAGVSVAFFVTHLSPINPVDQAMSRITARSSFSPDDINALRDALTDMYGVERPMFEMFVSFWQRAVVGDFGPSIMAFPNPSMDLVMRALPWTVGLLLVATILTWLIGNILGGLAGYYQNNRFLKAFGVIAMGLQPIPYYIVAFITLIVFGFLWPILPISGGYAMNVRPSWSFEFAGSILRHSLLPSLSLVLVGLGTWFLGMRALVSNVVTEDYVTYAELAGVRRGRIVGSYVIRNALMPQLTGLALSIGGIFSGTVITEQVFGYPGLGTLLIDAVNSGDFALVLAVSTVSITAVATAIFIIDILHPLFDPRVKVE